MQLKVGVGVAGVLGSISKRLVRDNFLGNVVVLAGGTALGQGLAVLLSPLITRLYTPEDFGVFAVYVAVLSILVIVASLRYELAIPLPGRDATAANLLTVSLIVVLAMSLLSGIGAWLLGESLISWTNCPGLKPYLLFLPLSLLGAGTYQVFNYWSVRKKAFKHVAKTKIIQSVGQVSTQIGLGLLKFGPLGLVLGDMVGRIGGCGTLAALAWRQDSEVIKGTSWQEMRRVVKRYWRFPLLSSGAALLNSVGLNLTPLLLAAYYGAEVVGWFALGQRLLGLPLSLLGNSVAQVYLAESARLVQKCPEKMPGLFKKIIFNLMLPGFPLIGLAALAAPYLFTAVFGQGWGEAGIYLRILSPMFLLQFLSNPTGGILDVLECQGLSAIREMVRVGLTAGGVIWAGVSGYPPVEAIILLSVAGSAGYIVYGFFSWLAIRNYLISKVGR